MTWWEAIILGLVQGLAEFLPVSSSGHLVLGQYFLGIDEPDITFEVFVHFGTVLSIVTVYWRRILTILREALGVLRRPGMLRTAFSVGSIEHTTPEPLAEEIDAHEGSPSAPSGAVRLALFIGLSMIPTGLVYVFFWRRAGEFVRVPAVCMRYAPRHRCSLTADPLQARPAGPTVAPKGPPDRPSTGRRHDPGHLSERRHDFDRDLPGGSIVKTLPTSRS